MFLRFIGILLFSLQFLICLGQENPELSPRYKKKLSKKSDSTEYNEKYALYFKRDSIKWAKKQHLYEKGEEFVKTKGKQIVDEKESEVNEEFNNLIPELPKIDSASILYKVGGEELKRISELEKIDTAKIKGIVSEHISKEAILSKLPVDTAQIKRYLQKKDTININDIVSEASKHMASDEIDQFSPYVDEAKNLKDSASFEYVSKKIDSEAEKRLGGLEEIKEIEKGKSSLPNVEDYKNFGGEKPEISQEDLQERLQLLANDKFSGQVPELEKAKTKVGDLKKKFSDVTNSNDLSSAVKQNSLQDKNIKQRFTVGGNFQIQNMKPLSLDASPTIGYRVNKLFQLGVGAQFRHTFSDSVNFTIPSASKGYKVFVSHNIFRNFYGHMEYERQKADVVKMNNDSALIWNQALHIGLGRNFKVTGYFSIQMLLLYNLIHDPLNPIYKSRWNLKTGFQLNTEFLKSSKKNK